MGCVAEVGSSNFGLAGLVHKIFAWVKMFARVKSNTNVVCVPFFFIIY